MPHRSEGQWHGHFQGEPFLTPQGENAWGGHRAIKSGQPVCESVLHIQSLIFAMVSASIMLSRVLQ